MRSYWPAIIVSVLGHGLLIAFVMWGWETSAHKPVVKQPSYIKATLVELKPKAKPVVKKPVIKPKPKPKDKSKELKKKKALEKKKQEQKKRAEKKRKQVEQQRKNQLAKKKAAEKKKKAEAKKREEERKKQLEKQRQAEQEKQDLIKSLAAERARLDAEKQAAEDEVLVQSYMALMAERVERNWSRPPSARNGMEVLLRIQLVPTGQVVSVEVSQSSGDSVFDRSAIRAVKKVDRFPELKNVPARVFEKQFRVLSFIFSPEDLRQ